MNVTHLFLTLVAAGAQVKYADKAEEDGSVPAPEGITATATIMAPSLLLGVDNRRAGRLVNPLQ
jgi:hypothetical protein